MKYRARYLRFGLAVSLSLMTFSPVRAQMTFTRPGFNTPTTIVTPRTAIRPFSPSTFFFSQPCSTTPQFTAPSTTCLFRNPGPRVINCTPAACSYPVVYPAYYYGATYGYVDVPATYAVNNDPAPSQSYAPTGPSNYANWGRDWGQDLRRNVVTWEQFVLFLKEEIVNAAPEVYTDFRRAFIEAYGSNGAAALDKALGEARAMQQQATGPKIITMPAKTSD